MPELRHLPYDWLHVGGAAWGSHNPRSTGGVNLPSDIPTQAKTGLEWATLFDRGQAAASKRSWFITLVHAATKSFTNFSFESEDA